VQKDDRRAVADRCVKEANAVDLGVAGVLAGDRGRSRRQGVPQRLAVGGLEREQQQQQEGERGAAHGLAPFIGDGW
jgi:hypothetical protein